MLFRWLLILIGSLNASTAGAALPEEVHPGERRFAEELALERGGSQKDILEILHKARYQQSIIDAISRPAESKEWKEYRPIFLTERRIQDGVLFYRANQRLLKRIESDFAVPAPIIVAIIGMETNYGRSIGRYRVLDALVTLAFYYPPRALFFRGELKQLLSLHSSAFPYAPEELFGSYAGAMGWGQFMPTSVVKFAYDYDGDGKINLWNSLPDICASVANYFALHGWQKNAPIALRPTAVADVRTITNSGLEPSYSLSQLAVWGYPSFAAPDVKVALLQLQGAEGAEVWVTFQNFYVISRYNKSPLYSLAVYQLSEAIAEELAAQPML